MCIAGILLGVFYPVFRINRGAVNSRQLFPALFSGVCIGILWAASVGQSYLHWQQLNGEIQQDVTIVGRVADIRAYADYQKLFVDHVRVVGEKHWPVSIVVQLGDYNSGKAFRIGQVIQANVKLKPARAVANPSGFNVQKWFVSKAVVKTGYVLNNEIWLITPDNSLRGRLLAALQRLQVPNIKWLAALIFGDRSGFTIADWQLLQRTGTAHLFVISGLHLVIVGGFVLGVLRLVILCSPKVIEVSNALPVQWLFVLFVTGGYAYFAHWQLAVVRAYTVVVLLTIVGFTQQRISRVDLFFFSLAVCLVIDPMSVYGKGLYLSFGAVGIILLSHWRWHKLFGQSPVKAFVLFQFFLTVGMLPLLLGVLSQFSAISPLVNIAVIPVMTFVIVPCCVISLLILLTGSTPDSFSFHFIRLTGELLEYLISGMQKVDALTDFSGAVMIVLPFALLVAINLIWFGIILPRFYGKKRLMCLAVFACFQPHWLPINGHNWQVHVFDVGQGTAVLLTQRGQGVLFDTGASFRSGNNYFQSVIQPFLTTNKLELLQVFISHFDNDHAGGLQTIKTSYPNVPIYSTENQCVEGFEQHWHSLTFRAIWPIKSQLAQLNDNNSSCVVKVASEHFSVLLPGDIEASAEKRLVKLLGATPEALGASLLIAPHHGSKTSSSMVFVQAVDPEWVVFTNGWLNRWGFPHSDVIKVYNKFQTKILKTSHAGYIRFDFSQDSHHIRYRAALRTPWYHKTFVVQ